MSKMWLKAEKARIIIMSSLRCFKPKGKMYYCLICLQSINTFLLSFNLEPPICGTCLVKKAKTPQFDYRLDKAYSRYGDKVEIYKNKPTATFPRFK